MKASYQDDAVTIYHGDCREIVPTLGMFDLCLTDPPYGIGESSEKIKSRQRKAGGKSQALADQQDYGTFSWDNKPISDELICSMFDISRHLCVWGGNYYEMPPSPSWLVWDKKNGANDFADAELAWTNYGCAVRLKQHLWNGMLRKGHELRFHPTQKPLEIMSWCISLCPDNPQTVLDPFAGSCTTGRAAKDLGRKCVCIEMEEKYCEIGAKRMGQEVLNFNESKLT